MRVRGYNITSGNSKVVRSLNRAVILNIIREYSPIARIKIASLTGLNKSTVSSIVTDLLEENLIQEEIVVDQNVGRNPLSLSLKLSVHFVGAINIDSSLTRLAITDIDGSIIGKTKFETKPKDSKEFIDYCLDELNKLKDSLSIDKIEGIGISVAGIVDSKT